MGYRLSNHWNFQPCGSTMPSKSIKNLLALFNVSNVAIVISLKFCGEYEHRTTIVPSLQCGGFDFELISCM